MNKFVSDIVNLYLSPFKKGNDFKKRASRKEIFVFTLVNIIFFALINILLYILLSQLMGYINHNHSDSLLFFLLELFAVIIGLPGVNIILLALIFVPTLTLIFRRIHDFNCPDGVLYGGIVFIYVLIQLHCWLPYAIPTKFIYIITGIFFALIYFIPGTKGDNKYGPQP